MVNNNTSSILEYFIIPVPLIIGFIFGYMCRVGGSAGADIVWRPPSWFFGFIWTVLYTLLGYVWYRIFQLDKYSIECNVFMTLLIIFLNTWVVLYSNNCGKSQKTYAVYILFINILVLLLLLNYLRNDSTSQALLLPLLVWLLAALLLNVQEVQLLNNK